MSLDDKNRLHSHNFNGILIIIVTFRNDFLLLILYKVFSATIVNQISVMIIINTLLLEKNVRAKIFSKKSG